MQDLAIHILETEIAKIKARPGNPLDEPMLAALARIVDHEKIVEAYVTPTPVSGLTEWPDGDLLDAYRAWAADRPEEVRLLTAGNIMRL